MRSAARPTASARRHGSTSLDHTTEYPRGRREYASHTDYEADLNKAGSRKYVTAWDIGRHHDAAVGIVLDVTDGVHDVVCYRRLRGVSYPQIQYEIEAMHHPWPGLTVIEDNAAGQAVRENLNLPEHEVIGFTTTASSKARIIQQLRIAVQNCCITWHPEVCPQLDAEMRGYQLPDDHVVQDSVIALAIALEHATHAHQGGRILGIHYV
jgi:hypothetical protein